MVKPSTDTHEFCHEKLDDDSCLFTTIRHLIGRSDAIDNIRVCSLVADYISKNEKLHFAVLENSRKCKSVNDYCNCIRKGNIWDDEPVFQALAMVCRIVIHIVSISNDALSNVNINILHYGEDVEKFKECIYVLYDGKNKSYQPLYLINKQNSNEKLMVFERYDKTILQLMETFIREKLHYDGFIQLDCYNSFNEIERPTATNLINETERICSMVVPQTQTNLSNKKKLRNHEDISFSQIQEELLSTSNNNYDTNKPIETVKDDSYKKSACSKNNPESMTVEQYLSKDIFSEESNTLSSTVELQEEKMKFEIEPAIKFRGRTAHEFIPKKALKRNGQPSQPYPPRYFADRNNNHYLNLLIPEKYLSSDAEHRLEIYLITREINGCAYVHPYFKFQIHTTEQILHQNPKYVIFDISALKRYSKGIKQLSLQLVVVMHTNSELMQSEQPLPIFSILNNGSAITTTFDSAKAFKNAYDLHALRFAITLWKKKSGEEVFHRCDDIQYISQISIEYKNVKIRQNIRKND